MASDKSRHRWRFHRAGGTEQVQLETGEDLVALGELDQKLWVALACPVDGLTLDAKTLELVDADKDGRIRAPELIAAIQWAASVLKDTGSLVKGSSKLPIAALNDTDEGKKLAASAKQILRDLGKKGADAITVEDTTDTAKIFADTKFNGDGVLPAASADDEDLRKAITEILGVVGGVKDRSGADGVDQAGLDKFFTEAEAGVLPLGDATTAAAEAFRAVQPKIDDYFTRVRLAAFDDRASAPLNRDPAEYAALAGKLLTEKLDEIRSLPLARVEARRALPLTEGLNPAWFDAVRAFAERAVTPLLGDRTELTEAEWRSLSSKMAAHEAWRAAKAGASVEPLGLPRVREMLEKGYKNRIADLIAKDLAVAPQADAIASVDKLVRYYRDLFKLANNFVTFRDFYARKKATFQIGTLYLDGRSCDLCVKVADAGAHSAVALASGACLAYCDLTRKSTDQKMTIVAAFTNGDADNLQVGRNGLFYDRAGADWDATIVKLVENPISVRQAFWTPYKRVAKLIDDQIEKFASSRDKEMQDKAAANVTDTSKAVEAPSAPGKEATAFDVAKFAGIFAAIGLALGMLGSALAAVATGFLSLTWWQMPLALAGVLLLISGPSMLIAYMKLRRRNLAPILDGAGWAVNARARINIPFGASLTQMASLPEGAERTLSDPYEEKSSPWPKILVIVAILAAGAYLWKTGRLRTWLHDMQSPPPAASVAPSAAPTAAPAK